MTDPVFTEQEKDILVTLLKFMAKVDTVKKEKERREALNEKRA